MTNKKIKIHVKNNHWAPGSFPTDAEGEKNFTITKEHFAQALNNFPEIKEKVEIFVDWDEDNFKTSMANSDILVAWDFSTINLKKVAPNLKWIHVISAGIEHLHPLDWMFDGLVLTNSSGAHTKKAGEYGLMSILMLQNHMTKIITNQKNNSFVSLFSNPIAGKTIVLVGTGNLGASMAKLVAPLGVNIIGVNKRGRMAEGCSKVISIDKIDTVLPDADFLYLAVPETPETKNLISKERLNMLKYTCGIVNIGRQSVMDYDVLCKKLINNEIAGAIAELSKKVLTKEFTTIDTKTSKVEPNGTDRSITGD